jgi:heat shock protein HslJ
VKLATIGAALAAVLALGACDDGGEKTTADPAALEGTAWALSGGVDVDGWEEVAPSVNFERGKFGGSDGCNLLGGSYEVSGGSLRIEDIFSTAMACGPPSEEVADEFMAVVESVDSWGLDGKELVLASGSDELRFRPASVEGSWRVTSLLQGDGVSTLLPGTEITAEFGAEGVGGSAGCNLYGGELQTRGRSISIQQLYVTEMLCSEPAGIAEQEEAFLAALPRAAKFQLEGGNLVLLTAKGTVVATLEPAPEGGSDP